MHSEISGPTRRGKRVLAGEGTVTPVKPIALRDGDVSEVLVPGRDRLSYNHPLVYQYPERFRPTDPKDVWTRADLRRALTRAARNVQHAISHGGTTRATTKP